METSFIEAMLALVEKMPTVESKSQSKMVDRYVELCATFPLQISVFRITADGPITITVPESWKTPTPTPKVGDPDDYRCWGLFEKESGKLIQVSLEDKSLRQKSTFLSCDDVTRVVKMMRLRDLDA